MQAGDLVKVETKHEGKKLAIVVEPVPRGVYYSELEREWFVKRLDSPRMTIASACDLELVSEGR